MLRGAMLVALAFVTLSCDLAAVDAATWRVPLDRHLSASARGSGSLLAAQHGIVMATHGKRASVWQSAFLTHGAPLGHSPVPIDFNVQDGFSTTVYFGTPPQPVSVMLDIQGTTSMVLNHAVGSRKYYDHTKSATYQANGTRVVFNPRSEVELDGFMSRDHVSVGAPRASHRIDVRDHSLVELDGPDSTLHSLGPSFGGSIGLGLGRSRTTGEPSFGRAMVDQGLLDRPEIGVSFCEHDAHVLFGGIDDAYERSDIHYFNLGSELWSAPVSGISVDGNELVGDVGNAMLSYWPFMIGPKDSVEALAKAVGVKNDELPCDGPGPDIVLHLGPGLEVAVGKRDYAREVRPGVCKFMFMDVGFGGWMIGLPFLQNVYTVLEYAEAEGHGRIGFANIKRS